MLDPALSSDCSDLRCIQRRDLRDPWNFFMECRSRLFIFLPRSITANIVNRIVV